MTPEDKKKLLARFGPLVLGSLFLFLIYLLRDVLAPFLMAIIVAYIFDPVVCSMQRWKLSRGAAVSILVLILLVTVSVIMPFLVHKIVVETRAFVLWTSTEINRAMEWMNETWSASGVSTPNAREREGPGEQVPVPTTSGLWAELKEPVPPEALDGRPILAMEPEGRDTIEPDGTAGLEGASEKDAFLLHWIRAWWDDARLDGIGALPDIGRGLKDILGRLFGGVFKGLGGLTRGIVQIGVFFVSTAFILKDFKKMSAFFRDLVPRYYAPLVFDVVGQIDAHIRLFFRGALTVACVITIIYVVGLIVIGVPFSYLIGVVGGLANIIPGVGPFCTAVLAMSVACLGMEHFNFMVLVKIAALFAFTQVLDNTILTPKIVGKKVGMNPVIVIFALMVCAKFLGFIGVLLGIPIAATAKVLLSVALERYKSSAVFRGTGERDGRDASARPVAEKGSAECQG